MKTVLISFAVGDKWIRSQQLLVENCKEYGIDEYISYSPENLDVDYKNKYKNLLDKNVRGYGYWMWKSQILKQTFDSLEENDIIIYLDSGIKIINHLNPIIELCKKDNIVLFDNRGIDPQYMKWTIHLNKRWTKRDCFVLMDCDDKKYHDAYQVDASSMLFKKCGYVENFLKDFKKFSENENIISDLPNITKSNFDIFLDHRHDQSILSNLAIKYNLNLYIQPSQYGNYPERKYQQLLNHHRGNILINS
jgi:hypothetical protein